MILNKIGAFISLPVSLERKDISIGYYLLLAKHEH